MAFWQLALLMIFCADMDAQSQKSDRDPRLDGRWLVVKTELEGRNVPEGFNGSSFSIQGHSLSWTLNGRSMVRKLIVDRSIKPARFDQLIQRPNSETKTAFGIYRFDGEELVICRSDAGCERPKDFTTEQGDCDVTMTLRRITPKPKQ